MTAYESATLDSLREWLAEPPSLATRWTGKAAGPAGRALQSAVPDALLRAVLKGLDAAAEKLSGREALLRQAGVESPAQLREAPLETCDALAARVQKRAMAVAGGTGALLGIAGAAGLIADVPTLVAQALRGIRRTALCYGDDANSALARHFAVGVFALASATTMEEKSSALEALRSGGIVLAHPGVSGGLELAAQRELAKEAAVLSVTSVARGMGNKLGWRRIAAGSLPGVGALVGGSLNAWYLHDVTSTARHVCRERWLRARYPRLAV